MFKKLKIQLYQPLGAVLTEETPQPESKEYEALSFRLNGQLVCFRVARITPTKIGQFVSIWKRNNEGITAPYDETYAPEFLVICTRTKENLGQFVFPKSVLIEKGVFSKNGKGGKRGTRVYPPWDKVENKQAVKTQSWQTKYFLDLSSGLDLERARILYSL